MNTHGYQRRARRRLPPMVFDYVAGGADDEQGLVRNAAAFDAVTFAPRRFVDVSKRSTQTALWGKIYSAPIYIAPTGLNGLIWPQGDACLARAAADAGIPFALSTVSNMSIEEVANVSNGELWFQLYVLHRDIAKMMIERAQAAGGTTLIITIDVPVNGNRERDVRNGFSLPVKYKARTMIDGALHPRWSLDLMRREMDASFDYEALKWLRDVWQGKLIVKGVARTDDVKRCAQIGVDAAMLSNHGGRQIESAVSALATVQDCVTAADIPVFMDGAVTRGSHIAKVICLGASMVSLGRVLLCALGAAGEEGVKHCLSILLEELDREQAMLGAPKLSDLRADLIYETRQAHV